MAQLAMRQHGRVECIEQHFLKVLNHPIESSGELRYDAPDRLEKRTLHPHAETLLLTGGVLTVERAHSRRVMDLHAYPQVLPFVESIRATLAGARRAPPPGVWRAISRCPPPCGFSVADPRFKGHTNPQPV